MSKQWEDYQSYEELLDDFFNPNTDEVELDEDDLYRIYKKLKEKQHE